MKNLSLIILISCLLNAFNLFAQTGTVSGTVTYMNIAGTPIPAEVRLVNIANPFQAFSSYTQPNGSFTINNVDPGVYRVLVNSGVWTNVNSSDALQILLHYVGIAPLSGLYLKSADVLKDGFVNSVDALIVLERTVGMIPSYSPPYVPAPGNSDWCWDLETLTVNPGGSYVLDIKFLCTGDVDGI